MTDQPQNQLQVVNETPTEVAFGNSAQFEHSQRVAKMLSVSSMIPEIFRNNIPNTMIALEMANRIGATPLMVMQNLYIVHGKPSWSSTFIISAINACGRFGPLRFDVTGEGETLACIAWCNERKTGEKLAGPKITFEMAKAEGWVSKAGSKWKTMPELMIRYRAAAFFGRLYAPDILMGMHTVEEIDDFTLMSTPEQETRIENLLRTCSYDDQRKRTVEFKLNNGMSQGEAYKIISELTEAQLDPITQGGNYSQGDISDKVKSIT